jgi:membrane-bound serine protease (ClpP class)
MKFIFLFLILIFFNISLFSKDIYIIKVDGGISPATAAYIRHGIEEATEKSAVLLVIKLNTPGGLLEATREIVKYMLESKVPIAVYVYPPGGRAGSAGVFITLAAHIAAMAPGTNIGAAHPVGIGGTSDSSVMSQKILNDACAFIRTIAEKRDRNVQWAEKAVRESVSATETEALANNVINYVTPSLDSLLKLIDGKYIKTSQSLTRLETRNAKIVYRNQNWQEQILTFLSDPNIAYILLLIGIYGLIFELKSPGSLVPGIAGALSLMIAAYSFQMMPVNLVGIFLIFLAIILFVLEIFIHSFGMLTIGGVISFAIGSVMLIDAPVEIMDISISLIIFATIITGVFFAVIIWFGLKAQSKKKATGIDNMIGKTGFAKTSFNAGIRGKVLILGEIWEATSNVNLQKGDEITVKSIEGFDLIVEKHLNPK